jgi:leucyl/phenylalanyl-tRNA---protein transferase
MFLISEKIYFPPAAMADESGLLAIGGDLSAERLLLAYRSGIFPWYNDDEPILWWSPDPRFVLFPDQLKVSRSMHTLIKKNKFNFTTNKAFETVINNCSSVSRKGEPGTWISAEIQRAFTVLHRLGHAHSAEAWDGNTLVGGLYGVRVGNVFCGESMFSKESNASKFAFISYVRQLQKEGVSIIDCQVHTRHLESLGAFMMPRTNFMELLKKATAKSKFF